MEQLSLYLPNAIKGQEILRKCVPKHCQIVQPALWLHTQQEDKGLTKYTAGNNCGCKMQQEYASRR